MSRDAKIIIFSLILVFSIYNKNVNGGIFDNYKDKPTSNTSTKVPKKNPSTKAKEEIRKPKKNIPKNKKTRTYKGGKYKLGNNGYFRVNQDDVESFLTRFPEAINLDYSNYDYVIDTDYSKIKSYVFNENEIKSNSNWQRKIKASKRTTLKDKRSYSYNLFVDSKGTKGYVIKVHNYDDPVVYLLKRGAILSEVLLFYKSSEASYYYYGYLNTGTLNVKNNNTPTKESKFANDDGTPELFNIDSPDYTSVPKSGHSPYDSYFGKGIYNETDNSIIVNAPPKTHVVFIVIDTYTKRRVRNEFIRKGETFTMTKIPYGTYDYMYFTGRNWSNDILINNGTVKGGFKDYPNFNKNENNKDQMEFKRGYYGSYEITLRQTIGGNLETKPTSESDFFN